jgi:hypothetical protein
MADVEMIDGTTAAAKAPTTEENDQFYGNFVY